jgi:hypothetical protein
MDFDEESEEESQRQLTSLDALEWYSASHADTFEELKEWPYRRFIKAFSSFQRRKAVDEIENKKNMLISAYYGITEWKGEGDQQKAIKSAEEYYEKLKDIIWNPNKAKEESEELRELESNDPFLAASRRNIQKVIPPELPGQKTLESLPD